VACSGDIDRYGEDDYESGERWKSHTFPSIGCRRRLLPSLRN
jgi:hypothetical protein